MSDIGKELHEQVERSFNRLIAMDPLIDGLAKKAADGSATYKDAYTYANKLGEHLAAAFRESISSDVLPDGRMYYNIGKSVVEPALKQNYEWAGAVAADVQQQLNREAGISLKAIEPKLKQDKLDGFINRLDSEPDYDKVSWILDAPVVSFTKGAIDDTIRDNAEFQGKAGLTPKIVRSSNGGCCTWCDEVAGTYDYPDVPDDVYRRHANCSCTVDYIPDGVRRQNVYTKEWKNDSDARRSEQESRYEEERRLEELNRIKRVAKGEGKACADTTEFWKSLNKGDGTVTSLNFVMVNGKPAFVDGHNVLLDHSAKELRAADIYARDLGGTVVMLPRVVNPNNVKCPDFSHEGIKHEIKTPEGFSRNTVSHNIEDGLSQSNNIVLDISKMKEGRSYEEIMNDCNRVFGSPRYKNLQMLTVIDDSVCKILERV